MSTVKKKKKNRVDFKLQVIARDVIASTKIAANIFPVVDLPEL